jgi:hypothetical protein
VRIRLALLVLLAAAPLQAAVVAENDITVVGDRGADALRGGPPPSCRIVVPFTLAAPARVWAEASGLQGQGPDPNAAPEVFLDDTYLGTLRVEHGVDWRSPEAVDLSAGAHALLLRCAEVPDADDVRMESLRVMAELPGKPKPVHAALKRPQAKAAAKPSAAPVSAQAPAPEAAKTPDCGHLRERVEWIDGPPERGKTLSVFNGHIVDGGSLVKLQPGEAFTLLVKVPGEAKQKAPALSTGWKADAGERLCFLFFIDPEAAQLPARDARDYRPNAWEPLRFEYCGGRLSVRFAKAHAQSLAWNKDYAELVVGAQGLELGLKPAPPR